MAEPLTLEGVGRHEWMGAMVGLANILTRAKTFAPHRDATIDRDPAIARRLLSRCRRIMAGHHHHIYDGVIHGVRVRLFINSFHLMDYWRLSAWWPQDWMPHTGLEPPGTPQATIYAYVSVEDEPESAWYSEETRTAFIINNAWYGQFRAWTYAAAGRILLEEHAAHLVPAAAVERDGRAALLLSPPDLDPTDLVGALMRLPGFRFVGLGGVAIRYAWLAKKRPWLAPVEVGDARGWRALRRWMGAAPAGIETIRAALPDGRTAAFAAQDLDRESPPAAFVYPVERMMYCAATIAQSYPDSLRSIARGRVENAPGEGRPQTPEELAQRVCSDPATRVLLDPVEVFGGTRVQQLPMDPVRIGAIFLLRRAGTRGLVLEALDRNRAGAILLAEQFVAARPDAACDEAAEARYVADLASFKDPYEAHRERMRAGAAIPARLAAELEAFHALLASAPCYSADVEAVRPETLARVLARVLSERPGAVALAPGMVPAFLEGESS